MENVKGIRFSMLSITIDWLAGTFREFNDETEAFIRTYASADDVQAIPPRNGYTIAQKDGRGVQFLWNSNDNRMGYHVIFAGSALRNLFEQTSIQPIALLRACVDAGLRISRLDLAKDLTGQEIDGQAVYQSLKSGIGGGTARNISRIENAQGGQTIYVGSRQSERFVRLYDKAQETGDTSKQWWRLEVETKGETARIIASALVAGTRPDTVFDGVFYKMVGERGHEQLDYFRSKTEISWSIPKVEKQTDREKWIAEQVISAVASHYIDNPLSEAIKALKAVLESIDKHRKD